ncbi:MAG: M56 family metallopeptidase [Pyrinomonadaceae bacterium]
MYDFLGICLALAALLSINAFASAIATIAWRFASRLTRNWNATTRARCIFILRTFPATAALLAVAVFLIPSYLAFEPRQTNEAVSVKLGLLALFSAIGIALALWRGIATWLATKKLTDDWLANAEIIRLENLPLPAYRIKHQFPVVAVVGVLRPKLFVAGQIFDSLNAEELSAVIAHETAHVISRDNLKHWLMRICRDALVIFPYSYSLDKEWAEAIELAADEKASNGESDRTALDLAQAIIKIARLIPAGIKPTMPAGAFLIDGETQSGDTLARRIQRLIQLAESKSDFSGWQGRFPNLVAWFCFALLLLMTLTAINSDALAILHAAIERVVAFLS